MLIPKQEMRSRYEAAQRIMTNAGMEAVVLIGDRMPGDNTQGDFHYFVNNYVLSDRHCILMFPNSEPVLLAGGWLQVDAANRNCWIDDCRIAKGNEALKTSLVSVLKERGVVKGNIGTVKTNVTVDIYEALCEAYPEVKLVDVHAEIFTLRQQRSDSEKALLRRSAAICDGAFEHVRGIIEPGISENEIRAELERYMIANGAENCFTLISAGRYSLSSETNKLPLPFTPAPDMHRVKKGDTVYLEITPRLDGYWSQLVRYLSVGCENPDLEKVHKASVFVIDACVKHIRPGLRVGELCSVARKALADFSDELTLGSNVGHGCGLDLDEIVLTEDNETVLSPGMTLIIHPSILNAEGKCELFCGETYMVTERGAERLMSTDDTLFVI